MSDYANECRCGRPTRDAAYFCEDCGDQLARALGDIPWLVEELETTITGQRGAATTGHASPSAERPSPVNWGASEAQTHLRGILVAWVRFCDEEHVRNREADQSLPADDLLAMSRWLMWRVDGLALLDIGADAVEEIISAVAHCRRVIDRPADRLFMGACDECQAPMWARAGRGDVTCPRCGTRQAVEGRREALEVEAMDQLMDRLFTASEAAMVLCAYGLAPKDVDEVRLADRIRKWAKPRQVSRDVVRPARLQVRGHIRRADSRTRPAYRLGDVRDLLLRDTRKVA
jgi:predicted amidophosphoribosyltransferase